MWSALSSAIKALFLVIETLANALVKGAKSVDNCAAALERESFKLIPTDAQYKAGLDLAKEQRDARIAEEKRKLDELRKKFDDENKDKNKDKDKDDNK